MLKYTGAIGAAAAVVGVAVGYGASQLLVPTVPPPGGVVTTTVTQTQTGATTVTPPAEETWYCNLPKEQGALKVTVKDDRIWRMEPFPPGFPSFNYHQSERYRCYSPQRIKYPMKRKGWEPGGKSSVANRGKGEFVRITWEEAYSAITSEFKRMLTQYGPSAFLYAPGEHSDSWYFHNRYLFAHDFLDFLGGYTSLGCDGYSWGASRPSGASVGGAIGGGSGSISPTEEIAHVLQYSKMFIIWAKDPLVNDRHYEIVDDCRLMKQAGIKIVYVGASMDETAKNFADSFIPCHPYADTALMAAIAYVWITEGLYDQKYLDTHTVGFDEAHMPKGAPKNHSYKSYIMGLRDGVKKTPEWASAICGTQPREIRALAREWGSKPTAIWNWRACNVHGGGMVRGIYSLMAMRSMGSPGNCTYSTRRGEAGGLVWRDGIKGYPAPANWGEMTVPYHDTSGILFVPDVYAFYHVIPPELIDMSWARAGQLGAGGTVTTGPHWPGLAIARTENKVKQCIRDVLWELSLKADHKNPIFHRYTIGDLTYLYEYPLPGHSEVHCYMMPGGSYLSRHPDTNMTIRSLMNPKLEFNLALDPWLEPDCLFADIVLPTVTNYERADLSQRGLTVVYAAKCIEPLFEAKSDFDVWAELGKRMGVADKINTGPKGKVLVTEDDWLKAVYEFTTIGKASGYSWEDFKKHKFYEFKVPDTWHSWFSKGNWNWKAFWQDPSKAKRITESGLLELYSQSAVKIGAMGQAGFYLCRDPTKSKEETRKYESPNCGFDPFSPGLGMYLPNPDGPGSEIAAKYPLAVLTSHPKHAYHVCYQNVIWLWDEDRKEVNGYHYSAIHMGRKDADDRGIKQGDICRAFNHHGQILVYANVSERFMPGVAHITYGRWIDKMDPSDPMSIDKSGNVEVLCTGGFCGPYDNQASVQAVCQVEKYTGAV
jgi:trimethylamine-N-oxide reductase (cytochrome c)